MKKLFLFTFFIWAGIVCLAQQPTTVKPAKTVEAIAPNDNRANLDKMKTELKQLLVQYDKQLNAAQAIMKKIEAKQKDLDSKMKKLEAQDKLGNFEIQDLMSTYNQSESLTKAVLTRLSDLLKSLPHL